MNCRSAEPLFSSYIEDEISQEERRNLEAHFMGCRRCSVALRDLRATMTLVQREVPLVSTSAHFEEDVYAKIRSGEGLRPSAWELVRELLLPIRLRPAVMAGLGVSAVAVALTFSPVGQSLLRPAAPLMTEGGGVVTLSYYGAEKVVPGYNVMGVAKAALEATVRYLAGDLGPKGIRVNAISAGPIKTLAARGVSNLGDMLKAHAERAPLKRNVDPAEVGGTAAFLLSSAGSGITGETIYVDCGYQIMGM